MRFLEQIRRQRLAAVAASGILAAMLLAPTLLLLVVDGWGPRLSALAAAYQVVAAVAAAGALVVVALALSAQGKQAEAAQRTAIRASQIEILSIAMNDPATYLVCFGLSDNPENRTRFKRQAYTTMLLRRTLDLYRMRCMEEKTIRAEILRPLFSTGFGLQYWEQNRTL